VEIGMPWWRPACHQPAARPRRRIGSRSGLSTRHNIEVGAGWIDPDYRGELKIELKNFSNRDFVVEEACGSRSCSSCRFASPEVK